jgi:hypothetical protein
VHLDDHDADVKNGAYHVNQREDEVVAMWNGGDRLGIWSGADVESEVSFVVEFVPGRFELGVREVVAGAELDECDNQTGEVKWLLVNVNDNCLALVGMALMMV